MEGKKYCKLFLKGRAANIELTINLKDPHLVDIRTAFQPPSMQANDYFLKIDSTLRPDETFYHDVNGYLVSKRKIGHRHDYDWNYKKEDKINANNYPMCSFSYILDDNRKVCFPLLSYLCLLIVLRELLSMIIVYWSISIVWHLTIIRELVRDTCIWWTIPTKWKWLCLIEMMKTTISRGCGRGSMIRPMLALLVAVKELRSIVSLNRILWTSLNTLSLCSTKTSLLSGCSIWARSLLSVCQSTLISFGKLMKSGLIWTSSISSNLSLTEFPWVRERSGRTSLGRSISSVQAQKTLHQNWFSNHFR